MKKTDLLVCIIIFSIILFLIGILIINLNTMLISVLSLYVCMFIYAVHLKEKGLLLVVFLIAFFTFLLGGYIIKLLTGVDWTVDFNEENNVHIQICLFLSLIGIYIGFYISGLKKNKNLNVKQYDIEKDKNVINIRNIDKLLFYLTWIFHVIVIMERVVFVQNNSYIELYNDYNSNLPLIIKKISQINTFFMYIFLATLPNKKEIRMPILLFIGTEIISILAGSRSQSVTAILFIVMYYLYREYKTRKDTHKRNEWVKKSYIKISIVIVPLIIAFLGSYNLLRNNIRIDNSSIVKEFIRFFEDQGGSIKVIGYVKQYEEQLPKTNTTYVFNPIIAFFKEGIIGKTLFNTVSYKGNTIEMALYGNNLGATISYLVLQGNYLQGHGLGTQYIAEAYADFGYIGVILFNIFLGFILRILNFRSDLKWYFSAIAMSVIRLIIYMPRDFALSWISAFFSISNWGVIILIMILSKYVKGNQNRKEKRQNENIMDS